MGGLLPNRLVPDLGFGCACLHLRGKGSVLAGRFFLIFVILFQNGPVEPFDHDLTFLTTCQKELAGAARERFWRQGFTGQNDGLAINLHSADCATLGGPFLNSGLEQRAARFPAMGFQHHAVAAKHPGDVVGLLAGCGDQLWQVAGLCRDIVFIVRIVLGGRGLVHCRKRGCIRLRVRLCRGGGRRLGFGFGFRYLVQLGLQHVHELYGHAFLAALNAVANLVGEPSHLCRQFLITGDGSVYPVAQIAIAVSQSLHRRFFGRGGCRLGFGCACLHLRGKGSVLAGRFFLIFVILFQNGPVEPFDHDLTFLTTCQKELAGAARERFWRQGFTGQNDGLAINLHSADCATLGGPFLNSGLEQRAARFPAMGFQHHAVAAKHPGDVVGLLAGCGDQLWQVAGLCRDIVFIVRIVLGGRGLVHCRKRGCIRLRVRLCRGGRPCALSVNFDLDGLTTIGEMLLKKRRKFAGWFVFAFKNKGLTFDTQATPTALPAAASGLGRLSQGANWFGLVGFDNKPVLADQRYEVQLPAAALGHYLLNLLSFRLLGCCGSRHQMSLLRHGSCTRLGMPGRARFWEATKFFGTPLGYSICVMVPQSVLAINVSVLASLSCLLQTCAETGARSFANTHSASTYTRRRKAWDFRHPLGDLSVSGFGLEARMSNSRSQNRRPTVLGCISRFQVAWLG